MNFQELILELQRFWSREGCLIVQPYDLEKGAGTFNPATFFGALGSAPTRVAYVEPCRRPADGRYGENPNRLGRYFQFQVLLKPVPENITGLYLRGRDGGLVSLDAVVDVREGIGPQRLNHFDRVRAATLTAALASGFTLGEALDSLNALADEVLPAGSSTALAGESRELEESGTALYFAFLLAITVVFMVLASQFESLVHPFTVLLAVPLAVTGALVTLVLAGSTLNLYSQIGMILLIGLVTKNSILLVEYTNQLKERGMDAVAGFRVSGSHSLIEVRRPDRPSTVKNCWVDPVPVGSGRKNLKTPSAASLLTRPLYRSGVDFSIRWTNLISPIAGRPPADFSTPQAQEKHSIEFSSPLREVSPWTAVPFSFR